MWSWHPSLIRNPTKDQRGVGAAESERIRQHRIDFFPLGLVRHKVDWRLDRWIVEIDGRWANSVAHCQQREDSFHRTGCAEQVPDARFGRRHGDLAGGVPDQALNRTQLDLRSEEHT